MQIEELIIQNFRGISGEFSIEPEGNNVVLVGPNGSGKSSVVSAVDFLLTGAIQNLTGEGTGGISPKQHGPHIDAEPDEAWVEATIDTGGQQCVIRRQLNNPNELVIESGSETQNQEIEAAMQAADRGLHLFSREEILDFITSPNSTRFDRIQTLLDVEVDSQRKALRQTKEQFKEEADRLAREAAAKRAQLKDMLGNTDEPVDTRVSELQTELGATEPSGISSTEFTEDIDPPSKRVTDAPLFDSNTAQLIAELQTWFTDTVDEYLEDDARFRELQQYIHQNPGTLAEFEHRRLLELGQDAIDSDKGECPLCLTDWDPQELRQLLTKRLEQVDALEERIRDLESTAEDAQQSLTKIRTTAESLLNTLHAADQFATQPIEDFITTLEEFEAKYKDDILAKPPLEDPSQEDRRESLTPSAVQSQLEQIDEYLATQPEISALEQKWETLTTAERIYDEMIEMSHQGAKYGRVADECSEAHDIFLDAKDSVFDQVYDDIEEQFQRYYRTIHNDEQEFSMSLEPTRAGVDLEVDFYDRGEYQPHALHSEGHQDSMGICLYFALCDWLNEIENHSIVMLDDVVMSIDNGHRRPLANLLASTLSDEYQLFITTHDDSWHRHLRSEGVVSASNTVQFSGWDLANGPHTHDNPEMEWETIYEYLDADQVSQAAHQTRLMAEWYLKEICDKLDAKVPFKANGKWTMGDFKSAAISRYKELLKRSKSAENSWNRDTTELADLEEHAKDVFERCDRDGSALNPNIHWNDTDTAFADFSGSELRPAVEAYHDLFKLFWCEDCNSSIRLTRKGQNLDSLSCRCKRMDYNLTKNK